MNAPRAIAADLSQPIEEYRVFVNTLVRIENPHDPKSKIEVTSADGPLEALLLAFGAHAEPWLVLPQKSFHGLPKKRWGTAIRGRHAEIKKRVNGNWEILNAKTL
jgi:hypothetical protein